MDIGCGTGKNLVCFSEFAEAFGIDTSEEAIKFCKMRGLKNLLLQNSSEEISRENIFGKSFDLITMLDVLEHIEKDLQYLKTISNWLSDEGYL